MSKQIEVFQEMDIHGPKAKRVGLRAALIAAAVDPWRVDVERSADLARNAIAPLDVILYQRSAVDSCPAVVLTLWATDDGYRVPNIVPLEIGRLTYAQYNAALADFILRVARPVADELGFTIATTKPLEALEDWLSPDAAAKLKRFSGAANKSTGSSHPLDERRWFEFVVSVHLAAIEVSSEKLARWLNEVDGWSGETAHELAGDFEKSLALLAFYDGHPVE
jgi:hypothetical protein